MRDESKLFIQALNGQQTTKVPFWFMRQAGRYLPEYRELRAKKNGFLGLAFDPDAACEVTMQPIRRFEMDAAIIFSDILVVPLALGQDLTFAEGEGPKLPPLKNAADIQALEFDDEKLLPVYEALRKTRSALKAEGYNRTALIGFAGAPWTVASYMLEGGSTREFKIIKQWMSERKNDFDVLIEILVDATSRYLVKQVEAGAEALQIFDSWAGAMNDQQFREYSVEPAQKIVANVRKTFPQIPIIGFPKGVGERTLPYAEKTGVTAIGIDHDMKPEWAAKNLQPLLPVQGNLSPELLLEGGPKMLDSARHILDTLSPKPFIFNLGHGINKDTPVKHVEDLVKLLKDYRA